MAVLPVEQFALRQKQTGRIAFGRSRWADRKQLMVCVFTVMNKIVVAVSGTLFLAMMAGGFRELRQNRNIDNSTKRRLWWMVPVLLFVVYTMYAKLTGMVPV